MADRIRKIIHIDMDAFYPKGLASRRASVEQRDNPEYRGKPLAEECFSPSTRCGPKGRREASAVAYRFAYSSFEL
jgi:hypothetical protein